MKQKKKTSGEFKGTFGSTGNITIACVWKANVEDAAGIITVNVRGWR
jgi:hypothetical protein